PVEGGAGTAADGEHRVPALLEPPLQARTDEPRGSGHQDLHDFLLEARFFLPAEAISTLRPSLWTRPPFRNDSAIESAIETRASMPSRRSRKTAASAERSASSRGIHSRRWSSNGSHSPRLRACTMLRMARSRSVSGR